MKTCLNWFIALPWLLGLGLGSFSFCERWGRFFRWQPASVILFVVAGFYCLCALLALWMGLTFAHNGDPEMARSGYWCTFWSTCVTALCLAGRQKMGRQTRVSRRAGWIAVLAALLVVIGNSAAGFHSGRMKLFPFPYPTVEGLLIPLLMIYVIVFALREKSSTP